jgi:hypothetical protein
MMNIAFVVHVFDVRLHDGAADPAGLPNSSSRDRQH